MNENTTPNEDDFKPEEYQRGELAEEPAHELPPLPPEPTRRSRSAELSRRSPWLWAGLGALALVVVAVILALALGLPARLLGGLDAAAAAMPADTPIYLGVNLLQATPDKLDRIVRPVMAEVRDASANGVGEFRDTAGMLAELDKSLDEAYGFTFSGDIQPWLGQYLGFGITGDLMSSLGLDPQEAGVILAVEARDRKAADAFLGKLRLGLVEKTDQQVAEQDYQGVTIYTHEVNRLAFARSGSLVLFASRLEDVQAAIDAQRGDSLGDQADFKAIARQLPRERFLTMFVDGEGYQRMLSEAMPTGIGVTGLAQFSTQMQAFGSIAASLAVVDEGLQMDALALYDIEKISDTQRAALQNAGQASRIAEVMPADTLLLFAGQGLKDIMQINRETLGSQIGADYDEAMLMLSAEIGFNLDTDLLAYLEGEYGLALVPEPDSIFAQMGVPLGVIFASRIGDHEALESTIQKFNSYVSRQGATVKQSDVGEDHVYTLGDPFAGDMVAFGLSQDHLAIGLTSERIENVFNPAETLADDSAYREAWTHFSRDAIPFFYLKLPDLLEALRGGMVGQELESFNQSIAVLKPVSLLAMVTSPVKNNQVHSTLIVFIEKAE